MNKIDVERHQAALMAAREAIVRKSHEREAIWVGHSSEVMETVQLAAERDFAIRSLELENSRLTQIDAALERIEDGEFGICLECEELISAKRLAAVPWAAYCLRCQEMADRRQAAGDSLRLLAA